MTQPTMPHSENNRGPINRLLKALLVLILPLCGVATAQQNPSVTGHVAGHQGFLDYTFTINAVQLKSGDVVGHLHLQRVYDNGIDPVVVADLHLPVDELIVNGNRAYVRAGAYYLGFEDNGEGPNAAPDRFLSLKIISTPLPTLEWMLVGLNNLFGMIAINSTTGNLQVRG